VGLDPASVHCKGARLDRVTPLPGLAKYVGDMPSLLAVQVRA
jgi:hypothetical protein